MDDATSTNGSCMPADVIDENLVLFAVPKKGRLHDDVMKVLNGAGLEAKRPDRLDVAKCKDLPVKLVFLPAKDIPSYILDGNVDLGISGTDMLEEALLEDSVVDPSRIEVKLRLGFGKCKLCLQAPKALGDVKPEEFVGKRIVTSFPHLTKRYFNDLATSDGARCQTSIKVVSGSVEAACGLGLADAVVDLVETGTTMRAAGLEVVSDVMETEAVLLRQSHRENMLTAKKDMINLIQERIEGFMTSTRHVMIIYNCNKDHLAACTVIAPGKRSPTVTALSEDGFFSVSVLVEKSKSHSIMDKLSKAGALDILCVGLANTRM